MTGLTYDEIAAWYADWVGDFEDDPVFGAVEELIGEVRGACICDLACGEGRAARYLAGRGAIVTAVDSSVQLLGIAVERGKHADARLSYVRDDAQQLAGVADEAFDGVLCHLALMDIPDLSSTLRAAARVLRPGGWFVFSILHPCFHTPASSEGITAEGRLVRTVSGYWDEGFWRSETRPGPPGKVGAYHRTLGTYVNELAAAGLVLEGMAEPRASGEYAERRPVWAEVPAVLVVWCVKQAAGTRGEHSP